MRANSRLKGASKKPNEKSHFALIGFKRYWKVLIAVVLALVVGSFFITRSSGWFSGLTQKLVNNEVEEVVLKGEFKFVGQASMEDVVGKYIGNSFLEVDLKQMKMSLELNPWVDSISVSRVWPNKIVVLIQEHKPIAIWGENRFLNMRGDIVNVDSVEKLAGLPFLSADDMYASSVLGRFFEIGKLLKEHNIGLSSISLDETMSWTVGLNNSLIVKLGREKMWEKLQHLMSLKNTMSDEQFNDIKKVDMRYEKGFAVSWKDLSE